MTSRKRNNSSTFNLSALRGADSDRSPEHKAKKRRHTHKKRRQNILETLEARQLLAADGGPQLIGIQPNTGEVIVDNSIVQTRPRVLTLRFDEDQQIDPNTLSAVQVTRAGEDNLLGTEDDVAIVPGLVTLGEDADNEVVVRFSEALVDDHYKIEVIGYDDPSVGLVGLRNTQGELLQTSDPQQRVDVTRFDLRLGALVESVVPQPVVRLADGTLRQNRDEILVHFNDDPLFVENDEAGNPTLRSVENPRFYQLLLTQETVRTSDDALYQPEQVVYDEATNTARLIFATDLNELLDDADSNAGVGLAGGTFRLRIGTAVDERVDLIIPLDERSVAPLVMTDFGIPGLRVTFQSVAVGESNSGRMVRFEDSGGGGLSVTTESGVGGLDTVVVDFGGATPTIADLQIAITNDVPTLVTMTVDLGDDSQLLPTRLIDAPALSLVAVGETLETALNVGVFGNSGTDGELTSIVYSESIDPQPFLIEPIGGDDDLGHSETVSHINAGFGPDLIAGVTEVAYNFQGIFATDGGVSHLNQITETEKVRIREALNLWASELGIQFRETADEGITFAFGDNSELNAASGIGPQNVGVLNATLRIDPAFDVSAMVFDRSATLGTDYGEDLTRKAVAGIGLLIGLERASDLSASTIMAMNGGFLNASINTLGDNEPVFPGNTDVLHGQFVHRPDSVDIDLYRFEVDLDDPTQTGTLTAETFAERLADSSLLDTSLTLFEENTASITTDFGLGIDLSVIFTSLLSGRQGNGSRISFVQTDRGVGDTEIRVLRAQDASGVDVSNGILIDFPRLGANVTEVQASDLVDAINDDPFASSIFRASIPVGDPATNIIDIDLGTFSPLRLSGGGLTRIQVNDDYFGEDSRIRASLGEGVYYLGVAASGNDQYDPTISGSGYGGRTQGAYDLHLKFEPQVDETDVIRDRDGTRTDVPGTPIDADGDGVPGGVHNFWFQTRALDRMIVFEGDGSTIEEGQTITIMGGSNFSRTYEFVTNLANVTPGNIGVQYDPVADALAMANALRFSIEQQASVTGVSASTSQREYQGQSRAVLTLSGDRSVTLSEDFQGVDVLGRTLFVDKNAGPAADGTLSQPFNNIANPSLPNAFGSAYFGDIVRIVGNGGLDSNLLTEEDNFSYKIGIAEVGGSSLEDGSSMNVPRGVTTMIDAGAIFKLRNSYINVGSSTTQIDRSGGALQILGAPRHVQLSLSGDAIETTLIGDESGDGATGYADGSVIFTSMRDRDVDANASGFSPEPAAGNWGGIIYRRDVDRAEGRSDLEDDGVFLQTVNHAEIRYGGGSNVLIDSVQQLVNPVQIVDMRPTVSFNEIRLSADSAISAAPNSFEETSYQAPQFQKGGSFTADYDRVGPDMYQNLLLDNSLNAVFIRVATTPVEAPKEFTVAARFDDTELVHYVSENLVVAGSPGGSIEDGVAPSMALISARRLSGGPLGPVAVMAPALPNPPVSYDYKMTFVDANGFESLASADVFTFTVADPDSAIQLTSLPAVPSSGDYVSRRLYRSEAGLDDYRLVGRLDASTVLFTDDSAGGDAALDLTRNGIRGRLDASLVLDPAVIMKLRGARIELGQGTQLLAEGRLQSPIVFTSSLDDRFGAGGTFDTNNDNNLASPPAEPVRGDWAGIYAGPTSNISFDHVQLSYAGGISLLDGGLARGFLPLELQQAEGRITNSRFEFNDQGQDGAGPAGRFGRLAVTESTIMVRGSQPIIVGNTFVDNRGSIIDIDIESMGGNYRRDIGRQTGEIDRIGVLDDNYGPMIRFNRYLNDTSSGLQLSGLEVRAGTITTETTFDDTDIAHLLFDNITVGNLHSSGGLRLLSRPDESLVVKFIGSGSPNAASVGTGITATGSLDGIDDRIGGTVHVVGMPGAPVILTSMNDDGVGAGLKPDGSSFTDHDGDGITTRGAANDWNGIVLDEFSNDSNYAVVPELELLTEAAPGLNGTAANAQFLGELAKDNLTADTVRRLGFEIDGYLSGNHDIDTYSFIGSPGSEVWVDVDRSTFTLDTVVELLDAEGNVLARSDNSVEETSVTNPTPITVFSPELEGLATSLQASDETYVERDSYNNLEDFGSYNLRDGGLHFPLTGDRSDPNSRSVYFVRVRSASLNPDDAQSGLTGGQYRMQLRLTEEQAFPGSVVRFANIKYANNGIRVQGLMSDSPLLAEVQENESADILDFPASNDFFIAGTLAEGPQYIGNLVDNHDMVIGVGGEISAGTDVDLYNFEIDFVSGGPGLQSTVFDIDFADGFNRPNTNVSVFFDRADGNSLPELVYFGSASNVLDDLDSPLANDPALESLLRGSIANGDPFIGPVSLPEGNYYVAVTQDGIFPESLTDAVREPINSIRRIAEDRIGADVAAEGYSTANPPAVPQLFDPAVFVPATEFVVATDTDLGHGKPNHFAGVGTPFVPPPANIIHFESDFVLAGFDAPDFVSTDPVNTPNDTLGSFQQEEWSLADEDEIGDSVVRLFPPFDILGSSNTSTSVPHVSFNGFLQNDAADFFILDVDLPSRVILDVDGGWDIADGVPDPLNPPLFGGSVDTKLVILQPQQDPDLIATESLQLVPVLEPYDPFFPIDLSGDDEVSFSAVEDGRAGSNSVFDPFIETFLFPGRYWVGVLGEDSVLAFSDTGATATGSASGTYTLHVSMDPEDPHTVPLIPPGPGSQVLSYPRNATNAESTVTSAPFDLAGYVAEDLPTLYLNRSYEPAAGDVARLIVTSNENSGGSVLHTFTAGDWEQVRLSLGDFAGHTNIQLNIDYDAPGGGSTAEGLRVDDIVIGFAERGEGVFDAARGTTFRGSATSNAGAYQLELRHGTDFATRAGVITLQDDFDTNDRQNRSVTLVAPEPGSVSDEDTFVLGDGAVNQRFEFDVAGDGVTFGNTLLNIAGLTTSADVAEVIRAAINSQTLIEVEASTSGGLDGTEVGGGIPTDARVALHGVRTGSFDPITSVTAAPALLSFDSDGSLLIPAILHDGLGDSNHERLQGVVIVEHNVISDVRGVGIWSEPGERDTVPAHAAAAGFGEEAPPVGLSQPGAVINLPEENDSVLGGLAPGILIQNNTLDNAEFAGVKIAGQNQPWVLEVSTGNDILDDGPGLGQADRFSITAAGTTVNFEFEEIGDGDWDPDLLAFEWGAETQGGDGFNAGNVPVYYRHDDDFLTPVYANRATEYSSIEMLHSMRESIQGSILMTNALSELVELTVGPSLVNPGAPALYIEGAESVGVSLVNRPINPDDVLLAYQAPIYEAPQPFAKVVNNTFYGDDGQASQYPEGYEQDGLDGPHQASSLGLLDLEPNEFIAGAVETRVGGSHRAPYTVLTTLGDNAGPADLQSAGDVDFYRVYLNVGDRLIADIDTVAGGPDTVMRLFDEAGIPQAFEDQAGELVTISENDIAPDYLDPSDPTDYQNLLPDPTNERDAFIDFVADKAGIYYVGVSSAGNENYDTRTLSGRVSGADVGTGTYRITLEALAARSFVMSLANASGQALNGTTFTVTQIEDIPDGFPQISGAGPDNRVTFTFGGINATNDRIPDVMKLIEGQINAIVGTPFGLQPILPNIDYTTYFDSAVSPLGAILPGSAQALGGASGANVGLVASPVATDDSTGGFGHIPSGNAGAEIFTAASGSTEQWVFIENVAKIELSPEAVAAGLQLTPIDDGDPPGPVDADRVVEDDVDQLIKETGLLITAGASPTALNNVFVNLDDSLVEVASKSQEVIVVGNVFQYAEGPVIGQFPNSTGANGNDDFNITLGTEEPALAYPEANNFQPAEGSRLIDSSVNSVVERSAVVQLKDAIGLSASNILAPTHDVGGVLRADNPNYAPPGGIGGSVFKDRGSTELADFNGPVAIAETARDNDAEGIDVDPAVSFINLQEGVYREFRIQLRDNGDSSDPFTGIGVDDNTVVVPEIPGLREAGANITLIENDELLQEGIDYTFNYDSTRNLITLTPLAGVWQNDRSYRIEINNEDRDVLFAPASNVIQDGDQMEIIDSNGGQIVFEFEAGYSLLLPEPITLVVPQVGTDIGGVTDGDFFQLNDGVNPAVVFEFNDPGDTTLPGAVPIDLPGTPTPEDEGDKQIFLEGIAASIRAAIQNEVDNGLLDLDVAGEGVRVVLGAEPGATASTENTGMQQLPRTL
ncbi:MAG TPA: peptidase, partial [Rhodopirellula sp.]|nr:peptidase [Rhodopirellula sp.]